MENERVIAVKPNGEVLMIFSDEFQDLETRGLCERVSEVEFNGTTQKWEIKPFVGPYANGTLPQSFLLRADAIRYEIEYLNDLIEKGQL